MIEVAQNFLSQSAKARLDTILNHKEPVKFVRSLSPQELLITIKEIGINDCLEIVEMLHPKQVQAIFDFEIWLQDRANFEKAGSYLCLLFAANKERAIKQIEGLDIELIGLMMKSVCKIYDTTLNEEPAEYSELYSLSPDRRFIVCFSDKKENQNLCRALHEYIETLYGRDLKQVLHLLEQVRFELISGLEERSYFWRETRMQDLGVLPHDERMEILAPLTNNNCKNLQGISTRSSAPTYFLQTFLDFSKQNFPFFKAALENQSEQSVVDTNNLLRHIAINFYATLDGDFSDRESMKDCARYVMALVEIGIFQASNASLDDAKNILAKHTLKQLFRLGRTNLIRLKQSLLKLLNDENYFLGERFVFCDSPLREFALSICANEPLFFAGLTDANQFESRFLKDMIELKACIDAFKEIQLRSSLLGPNGLGLNQISVQKNIKEKNISHSQLLMRALSNQFLNKENILQPIDSEDLVKLFENSREGYKNLRQEFVDFSRKACEGLVEKLASQSKIEKDQLHARAQNFLNTIFVAIEKNAAMFS